MGSALKECARRITKGESQVRRLLLEDERYIWEIYIDLIKEIRAIGIKAPGQNFVNITGDLKVFIGDLNVLKNALPKEHKIHQDIDSLVKKIYDFIGEYADLSRQGLFTSSRQRLSAFLNSMEYSFKNTVLRGLWEKDTKIRKALEDLKEAA